MYEMKTAAETVRLLQSDREKGLDRQEVLERRAKQGANRLKEQESKSIGQMILGQLNDPLILILIAAMAISILLGEVGDAVIIVTVVVLNAVIGPCFRLRAIRYRPKPALRKILSHSFLPESQSLQVKLGELGKVLSILAVSICALLFVIAVLQKRNVGEMLLTSVSLTVAAVPEGLPAIVTIVLALSVSRMVRAPKISVRSKRAVITQNAAQEKMRFTAFVKTTGHRL